MESCSSPSTSCASIGSADSFGYQPAQQRCPICGDQAWNKHFNILCCNACAAFFRRTISTKKSYICLRGKACIVSASRPTCKFCRFQQCVLSGLNIAVAMLRIPLEKREFHLSKSPLRQLVIHRKATFVNRFQATVNVYGGCYDTIHIGKKSPNFIDVIYSVHAEFSVLIEYLSSTGFVGFGLSNPDLNGGYATNYIYFVDDSHLALNEEAIERFHRSCNEIKDPCVPSRSAYQLGFSLLNAAAKLHHARLDEVESATMCQIIILRIAARLFPLNERLKVEMNQLFENLRVHYSENFDDFATRLGNLILLTHEIEAVTHQFNEYLVLLNLSGYETVLSKIQQAQDTFNEASTSPMN